jgi:ATP-dependent RNA helicase SUPV3L1/SUV3
LDVFVPALLKPEAQRWRAALMAVRSNGPMPALPPPGSSLLSGDADPRGAGLSYRRVGSNWLRVDLADRLAAHAHKVRGAGGDDPVDRPLATSLGLSDDALTSLMREVGFRSEGESWKWRGNRRAPDRTVAAKPGNAFAAAFAGLKR